jgi:hypothetical protein
LQDTGGCSNLDYDDDVEPWLGNRMAVAAVDTGADGPTPVVVLQVRDEAAADAGLRALRACAGGDGEDVAWHLADGWALVGESQAEVDRVAEDAAAASLADDEDYTRWIGAAGDPGIAAGYLAPEVGPYVADAIGTAGAIASDSAGSAVEPAPIEMSASAAASAYHPRQRASAAPVADDTRRLLDDFEGAAASLRFEGGGLELEVAGDPGASSSSLTGSDRGDDVLSTLPDDTAVALGVGLADGWFGDLLDQVGPALDGSGMSPDDLLREAEAETGLDLPDDVETLLGDSTALAIGPDLDPFAAPHDLAVALKVRGDADGVERVVGTLRSSLGSDGALLGSDAVGDGGDVVAIGPNADYRSAVLRRGGLGGTAAFRDVVPHAQDSAAVAFVNFDAGGGWLEGLVTGFGEGDVGGDGTDEADALAPNLEPLAALGMSGWTDGDGAHALLRVTTD